MLQLTYELRPKWNKNNNKNKNKNKNNNKTLNAVSRSDPLQGSDKNAVKGHLIKHKQCFGKSVCGLS